MFVCQFGRYRYKWLPFGAAPAGNRFQRKIDDIFKNIPNVFGIADDILVAGYEADGKDHDKTVGRVLQRCRPVSFKLNKDKCHFQCTSVPFFEGIILHNGVKPDTQKIKALMEMLPPKNKKELQSFLGIINYLGKLSPNTASKCEPLWRLMLSRTVWTWNASYQTLYDKAKLLIKDNVCMKFYDETKPLYLETDASGIGLGTTLLQTRDGMTWPKDTHQTTPFWDQLPLQVKTWPVQNEGTVTPEERHWVYCIVLTNFTIIALLGR